VLGRLRDRLRRTHPEDRWPDGGASRFFVKETYVERGDPEYFTDVGADQLGIVYQPEVYPFAAHVARHYGCSHLIDLGCGRADKLAALFPEFMPVGVDFGPNLAEARRRFPFGEWIEHDFEQDERLRLPHVSSRSGVICADVIEHLRNPLPLLRTLRQLLDKAPFALLSTPERDLLRGVQHLGPPVNPHHVREWNLTELEQLLRWAGFRVRFIGLTASHDDGYPKETILAVLESPTGRTPVPRPAPDSFRVVALMPTFNEADLLEHSIRALGADGVGVYVIDNWSTDETQSIVNRLAGQGVVGAERFPPGGPARYSEWNSVLLRMEELSASLDADWFIHVDADERLRSPWPDLALRDAIYFVDQCGFNCIDHTVLTFHPVDDTPEHGDPEQTLRFFQFGQQPGHFLQRKAWKNVGMRPEHAESGGHDVVSQGQRVYPYRFLLKHYPVQSQAHGERNILLERISRLCPEQSERGWHVHHDSNHHGHQLVRDKTELLRFSREEFHREYLVERLSGIGVMRLAPRARADHPRSP
jgi:SAM-dependent methyltransferase